MACRACNETIVKRTHEARERLFGLSGTFAYDQCAACDSLTLTDVPDLAPFYPAAYYSIAAARTVPERLLQRVREHRSSAAFLRTLRTLGVAISPESKILDVGCGNGTMLRGLRRRGFGRLYGSDPFLSDDVPSPVRLTREHMTTLGDDFDLVVFNHSLEHVPDPSAELRAALRAVSAKNGAAIVRVPMLGWAWDEYRDDWVGLEAPRHLVLMTASGMTALARRAGGRIDRTRYDSTAYQFWGSERLRGGASLLDATASPARAIRSYALGELRYGRAARRLNESETGDAAAFLVRAA